MNILDDAVEEIVFELVGLGDMTISCPDCQTGTNTLPMATHLHVDPEDVSESMKLIGMVWFPCGHLIVGEAFSSPVARILVDRENHALSIEDVFDLSGLLEEAAE